MALDPVTAPPRPPATPVLLVRLVEPRPVAELAPAAVLGGPVHGIILGVGLFAAVIGD